MKRKRVIISIIIIGVLGISSMIIGILQPWNKQNELNIDITFIPTEMLSYPGHTAWLLADININFANSITPPTIKVETNATIEVEYKSWINGQNGGLVEIFLYPNQTHLDKTIEVITTVNISKISESNSVFVKVVNWSIPVTEEIIEMQERFIQFLGDNHPSFNINESNSWEAFGNAPMILVVAHYLFKSDYWELEISRHVTIAPHDWVKIYLRPRNSTQPIWSGMINSWESGNYTIVELDPPEEIYR